MMVSLCASPMTSPSCMITAPTGTSSRTEAARASRSACSMPVRSAGDGVPLRTDRLGERRQPLEHEVISVAGDPYGIALVIASLEQLERDRILQQPLNYPLQRSRAVHRVVAL